MRVTWKKFVGIQRSGDLRSRRLLEIGQAFPPPKGSQPVVRISLVPRISGEGTRGPFRGLLGQAGPPASRQDLLAHVALVFCVAPSRGLQE